MKIVINNYTNLFKCLCSDINEYAATNRAEFFSVVSEYFFSRPQLLESKHPELYQLLEEIFEQELVDT